MNKHTEKKIVAIGLRTNQRKNLFSGQAMMFDAFVDCLNREGYKTTVIDLTSSYSDIHVGSIALRRIIEYIRIISKSLVILFKERGSLVYITTAQTRAGFMRDFIFINFARIMKSKILIHQFGANFSNFYESLPDILKSIVKFTFNNSSRIVVEGEYTKKQFGILDHYENKVCVVPNGLPEKKIEIVNEGKLHKQNSQFRLLYLSYMIESKGYWDVLHAVDILVNKMKRKVHCVFSGKFIPSVDDVSFRNEKEAKIAFEEFVRNHSLEASVQYFEGLMGERKSRMFKDSHCFILPSYFQFEGQPVSVLEAMSYGTVPIVTNYRMIPTMVTDETGIFVEKKSPSQIAEAVAYLIDNPTVYSNLSKANIDKFKADFTLEQYNKKMLGIIELTK